MRGRVTLRIQLAKWLGREDGVFGRVQRDEAAVAGCDEERAQAGRGADGREFEGFADDAHFCLSVLCSLYSVDPAVLSVLVVVDC